MKRVFLGGTCNGSLWRNTMEACLGNLGLDYFNPVVEDWNEEAQKQEIQERRDCDFCVYTITPKMTGVYSIAEVVDDSNKRPLRTVLVLFRWDEGDHFTEGQWKSLKAVGNLVQRNGGAVFESLLDAAEFMARKVLPCERPSLARWVLDQKKRDVFVRLGKCCSCCRWSGLCGGTEADRN